MIEILANSPFKEKLLLVGLIFFGAAFLCFIGTITWRVWQGIKRNGEKMIPKHDDKLYLKVFEHLYKSPKDTLTGNPLDSTYSPHWLSSEKAGELSNVGDEDGTRGSRLGRWGYLRKREGYNQFQITPKGIEVLHPWQLRTLLGGTDEEEGNSEEVANLEAKIKDARALIHTLTIACEAMLNHEGIMQDRVSTAVKMGREYMDKEEK